jgi:Cu+-exporting ATPase
MTTVTEDQTAREFVIKEFVIKADSCRCFHCGNDCEAADFVAELEKFFCCNGCQTVYTLLHDNQMDYYYELQAEAGSSAGEVQDKYAYLDNEQIKRELLDFYDNGIGRLHVVLPQIHCTSCIWLLENLHKLNAGVLKSVVNFGRREANISFTEDKISLRQLVELLTRIGYAPNLRYDSLKKNQPEKTARASSDRSLIYKIGIAGFCFGNAMLLSFPDYLAISPESVAEYQQIFNYINFGLALPIVFYCSTDYFRAAFQSLKQRYISVDVPLSLGIAVIFIWSSIEIFGHTGTGYMDSLAGLLFFLLTGKWYQQKTYTQLSFERDYKSYFPIAVQRLTASGEVETVPLDSIKVGDQLQIRSQELIPADAILISPTAKIDYSFVTGEALPVGKKQGDLLYAGAKQVGATISIAVQKPVAQSYLTQLWNESSWKKKQLQPMAQAINRASVFFTALILLTAVGTALYWGFVDSSRLALTVTAVLIVACPCALALSMPYTFGNTMRFMGRLGLYLKNTETVEQLSHIDTIVFDKTGTLSQSRDAAVAWQGVDNQDLTAEESADILAIVSHSTHPLSAAVATWLKLQQKGKNKLEIFDFEEVASKGLSANIGGKGYKVGALSWVGIDNLDLAATTSTVGISCNARPLGYFTIAKQYRKGLENTLKKLKAQGYELHLLSGDNDGERGRLQPLFGHAMQFNQSPTDKLAFIESLQSQGRKVMMVGDGLNDAGALQQSQVGIAIVEDINLFSPASDAILDARQFERLPQLMQFSQKSLRILRLSFLISLAYNLVGLSFAVRGLLTPLLAAVLMPLSSVSVVGFVSAATAWLYSRFKTK